MKRKIIMSLLLVLSLSTMLWPWFGNRKGLYIYGSVLLENPISLTCIILSFIGIWIDNDYSEMFEKIGLLGIIAMQIYEFMTWHILTISGRFDLILSFDLCYPEFYYAVFSVIITYILFKRIHQKVEWSQ